jgi:hypothetical protein
MQVDLLIDLLPPLFVAGLFGLAWLQTRKRSRERVLDLTTRLAGELRPSDTDSAYINRALLQAAVESGGGALLDPSLRAMLAAAREEAGLGHGSVWPGHLLCVLTETGTAGEALGSLGITRAIVQRELVARAWAFGGTLSDGIHAGRHRGA